MKKYEVRHLVLCDVRVHRVIEAEDYESALAKVAAIETITATNAGGNADYEIIDDLNVKAMSIKEVQ